MSNSITDVPGIKIGHAQNFDAITGCTVILCEDGAVAGVDQRGGAPGTRETDVLNPVNQVDKVSAILLSGGSAFGLDAATGVVKYLSEKGIGYLVGPYNIPIVPSAILFDLFIGDGNIRPDAEMGFQACINASETAPKQGSVGAGTGATVSKLKGMEFAVKGGIGTASTEISDGVWIGAIVAVNAIGDVRNPTDGSIIAGPRTESSFPHSSIQSNHSKFEDSISILKNISNQADVPTSNTVIGVVATNAKLSKAQASQVAQMAQNGVVRTIRPANTQFDGDTMFCLSTGKVEADVNLIGAMAAKVVEESIINALNHAETMGGIPSITDI